MHAHLLARSLKRCRLQGPMKHNYAALQKSFESQSTQCQQTILVKKNRDAAQHECNEVSVFVSKFGQDEVLRNLIHLDESVNCVAA